VRILISGSHGLVGSALVSQFQRRGDQVVRLVRSPVPSSAANIAWNPAAGSLNKGSLEAFNAVIHLAGENLAHGRWTAAKKARLRDSRVQGTQCLASALATLKQRPEVFLCASAIGVYGSRGDELLDEESLPGDGFLASVCKEWEAASQSAACAGIRVVQLRFGVILSRFGGALRKMLTPFQLGLGGVIGSGEQYWSWISLDDVSNAITHVLAIETLKGPVNFVAPEPVANREFTKTLGRVLHRPTVFRLPSFAARLALGEMAEEALLASQRVTPKKLLASGYSFRDANLEAALRRILPV